jgi:hypothetical protein
VPAYLPAYAADKHHKLFGLFITREGQHRRMDLIFAVPQSLPWGLLGWIGSKQYLRMLKQVSHLTVLEGERCRASARVYARQQCGSTSTNPLHEEVLLSPNL